MDQTSQLGENFPVHAYLSYRQNPFGDKSREQLEALCSQQNITLRFDSNQLENG
jgi:hypothetical protein